MTAPRVHSVLIVPGYGHSDSFGGYDRGQVVGRYCELDVVDGYLEPLCDELDSDGVRFEVMDTRSRPGVPAGKRAAKIEGHRLVLHLCAGFDKDPPQAKNLSRVFYRNTGSKDIAEEIAESVSEWGQCFVFGHRTANPSQQSEDPLLDVPNTLAVRIEPFILNGPDADEYMRRLPQLGICLARAVAGYLMTRNQARARGVVQIGG